MKKKIFVPILIGIAIIIAIIVIGLTLKKPKQNIKANKPNNEIVEAMNTKNTTNEKIDKKLDVKKEKKLSDILTFDKEDGVLELYNSNGELLDELDLQLLFIEDEVFLDTSETDAKENTGNNYVYIKLDNDELVKTQIDKNKIFIYDEEGKAIENINIVNKKINKNKEMSNKEKQELLDKTMNTTFTNFRTINNELIFRDDTRNILIMIKIEDGKIITNSILKNVNLKNLTSVYLTDKYIYLTFDGNTQITQIPRIELDDKQSNIIKIEINEVPNFVIYNDGHLYFSTPDKIGVYSLFDKSIEFIEVGDVTLDMYLEDDFLYIINQFGRGKDNSVLIKVDIEDFKIDSIEDLRGVSPKFIGIKENIAYIRQKESIKKMDLSKLKIVKSFTRKEGVPVQVKDDVLYKIENGEVVILDIANDVEVLKTFENDSFNLYLVD